jgi:uncharacterized phage protein gp47/JayE
MFSPRTIDQISDGIYKYLLEQNTPLSDISTGSFITALTRAFSGSILNQELMLNELAQRFYLKSATGKDLDLRAVDYGVTRKPGGFAVGSILVVSLTNNFTIPINTILTEPITGLQYTTESSATTNSSSEVVISVKSLIYGDNTNLVAGTKLISPSFPTVIFLVGTHRTTAREICGDLSGGISPETDDSLRTRIINTIINSRGTTQDSIKNVVLSDHSISWASIATPLPGFIQVWVDSPSQLTSADINRLTALVNTVKAAGVSSSINQVTRVVQNINIFIQPVDNVNLQTLTPLLIQITTNYILNLQIGTTFTRSSLVKLLLANTSVLTASIITPTTDINVNSTSVVRPGRILVTYETN